MGDKTRIYGRGEEVLAVPDLTELQIRSYKEFLQEDVQPNERKPLGLEGILRETFPIESYDKTMRLVYLGYELGKPRYNQDECRLLKQTFGMPFKVRVRLEKAEPVEEDVYLGEIPRMVGGGEFIVNGAERVIVSQLHRSPGVDFSIDVQAGDGALGHVEDLLVDLQEWRVPAFALDTRNWLPGEKLVVETDLVTAIRHLERQVAVNATREDLRERPAYVVHDGVVDPTAP